MAENHEGNFSKVVKVVQELLLDEDDRSGVTPSLIEEKIDLVLAMNRKWADALDREAVVDELIRRFSMWIGEDTTLKSDTDHVAWLNAERKKDWRYWQRYREWLERKLAYTAVDALDHTTDRILGLLEDPAREGPWSRRGLVVGHVQSGKTSNYTALIGKAADAGYKIVIVLAGMHNNLRSQTQMRLDEGFLGYETKPVPDDIKTIGVGEIDADPAIRPNYATNRSDKGDFNAATARTLGISPEQRPWLFVVKKNKSVLERLYRWIRNHVANSHDAETGRKLVTHLPLLLVDDEADHASVDTGEQFFDENGKPDEDHQPTAINSLIRKILHSFSRSAYVGYTATPFANIFIHERGATEEEGPDLFPAAFIVNLAAPSNYIGPVKVFGRQMPEGRVGGLPLIRIVDDQCSPDGARGWMPVSHKSTHVPSHEGAANMPLSLVEAIDAFLLACAVRHLRGQGREHSSMLVHVTRFNIVQKHVHEQVATHLAGIRQRLKRRIGHEAVLERLRLYWELDFAPTMEQVIDAQSDEKPPVQPGWVDVERVLADVTADIEVRMINGTAKDALDYADQSGAGLKVIAIGGDKLARGLTLEGLCVSYFLRASKMYDTLMQMGRWFGYRPGYLDLCRLYTTSELESWFEHITDAAEELREEFELMANSGGTPRDYGLRVQSHSVLMVTSRLKMRSAKNLMLSFSGQLLETVTFHTSDRHLQANLQAAKSLLAGLGAPEVDPERVWNGTKTKWRGYLWRGARAADVLDFLGGYATHPDAHKVNAPLIAEFVRVMMAAGELTDWSVALIGAPESQDRNVHELGQGVPLGMLVRKGQTAPGSYSIGRLMSPRDESIDVSEEVWTAALALTREMRARDAGDKPDAPVPDVPSGVALRRIRGLGAPGLAGDPQRGLLLLYLIDPQKSEAGLPPGAPPLVGFGISFPGSTAGRKVEYKVNNVLWEQEYGGAD
ncbi:Z1 domain-containing protein [Ideonella sp.]|uniref:Z1 domain-containing protein n=1 Tax=Ideonella sp. TaxID=1929293 RepID=UPI003BB584C4